MEHRTAEWTDAQISFWDQAEFETVSEVVSHDGPCTVDLTSDQIGLQTRLETQEAVLDIKPQAAGSDSVREGSAETPRDERLVANRLKALEDIVYKQYVLLNEHLRTADKFDLSKVDWNRLCIVFNNVAQR